MEPMGTYFVLGYSLVNDVTRCWIRMKNCQATNPAKMRRVVAQKPVFKMERKPMHYMHYTRAPGSYTNVPRSKRIGPTPVDERG